MIVIQFSQQTQKGSHSSSSSRRRRRHHSSPENCENVAAMSIKTSLKTVILTLLIGAPLILDRIHAEPGGDAATGARPPAEYQLIGQLSQEAHLPCLIGRQLYCGEPYFIAWYKLNTSTKSWVRIEHKSSREELEANGGPAAHHQSVAGNRNHHQHRPPTPVNERAQFTWSRSAGQQRSFSSWRAACDQPTIGASRLTDSLATKLEANFDCAQLTISRLELVDEGQYKCEITFSESLDFDKCPATTLSQLSVIARPNEPELLINGRPAPATADTSGTQPPPPTFKEGAQVKLDCLSSGGRPAPRIEWLNVSSSVTGNLSQGLDLRLQQPEVQLMRAHWPQKKSTFLESGTDAGGAGTQASTPITSSSVTISVTRHDLHSHFVCLVLPHTATGGGNQNANYPPNLEQLIKSPAYLAALVGSAANQQPQQNAPMFKWIKLDVQVKPSSVSLVVRDLEADAPLEPVHWSQQQQQQQQLSSAGNRLSGGGLGLIEHYVSPFYSLQPNRLYAIQCIVENSRPPSQLAWFNKTAPISVEPKQLNSTDFLLPGEERVRHRLSSYTRSIGHTNGTFRSSASLLLTTNVWDNFEELFCRVSNEAFQLDELLQVAPIISARLYVNYAPFAWMEAPGAGAGDATEPARTTHEPHTISISRDLGAELTLRCSVAANPMSQNTILQIEWLKDGRKLATPSARSQQQQQQPRFHIEKANHLHMPTTAFNSQPLNEQTGGNQKSSTGLGNQLVASSKLIASSSLTIGSLAKSDSGLYTCHYKLIPAPSGQTATAATNTAGQQQQQKQIRITSGQANQSIQVNVIEAKPRAPTLEILSSKSLLVYGLRSQQSPSDGTNANYREVSQQQQQQLLTVIAQPDASISLRCHLPPGSQQQLQLPGGSPRLSVELTHKIMWHLNGVPIHSSGPQDTYYNFTLANHSSSVEQQPARIGLFSCTQHILGPGSSPDNFHGGQMRVLPSANQIELKLKVGPKLEGKRELMPPIRSFSELELNANLASKLRLVCMAQCEPICSIDWYLNRRPLGTDATTTTTSNTNTLGLGPLHRSKWGQRDLQQQLAGNATSIKGTPFWLTRSLDLAEDEELGVGLVQVDNLIRGVTNGTRFSWFKASSLGSGRAESETLARQLKQEALATLQHQAPNRANIFSKLELTYGQLARLLTMGDRQIQIKCKLNPMLNGQKRADDQEASLGHGLVEPMHWFPVGDVISGYGDDSYLKTEQQHHSFVLSNEPLNLTGPNDMQIRETELRPINDQDSPNWIGHNINSNYRPTDLHARKLLFSGQHDDKTTKLQEIVDDEMQITILLDKPPKRVSISFAGIVSTDKETRGVTISEGQLLELMDPNRETPLLWCQVSDMPYPEPQFKWTFTDLNRTEHGLADDGPRLNLRQVIELRQRQLNVDPMSAYGAEVVASIVGNYTCTANNIHGTERATLPVQIQGRPLCKLTLGSEYLGPENELMANLRCLIYSAPLLFETVWFRGSQQLALNKSSAEQLAKSPVSVVELPIVVLNRQQDFMLMDLMSQLANFKCIARNHFGYSEACELSQADRLTLINTFKPISGLGLKQNSPASNMIPSFAGSIKSGGSVNAFLANQTIDGNQPATKMEPPRLVFMPWLLVIVCAVALGAWLLILMIRCLVRRCYSGSSSKLAMGSKHNHNTSWRFNSSTRTNSNGDAGMGLPFPSKTICVNYYGDSNGDSEHDMMQSCSQSSHYDEYGTVAGGNQMQQQQQQQQPVYSNGHSTLTRRTLLKPSLSTSSAGDNSTGSRKALAAAQQLVRLGDETREFIGPLPLMSGQHYQTNKLAATMRESLTTSSHGRHHANSANQGGLTLTSNVPLINGAHNSRINLEQQQQHHRFQRDQQTFGSRHNEPIYDDVIYNQMIL